MEHIYVGFGRALGMLFVSWVAYRIYISSIRLASEEKPLESRWQYVFTVLKWLLIIAFAVLILSSIAISGGCDSFDNCIDPDPTPQAETWAYFFFLILVPAMIGLHKGLKVIDKKI